MTSLLSQKGLSSLEAAITAMLLVIFLSVFSATLYVIYISYWAEHVMYESLICYQERGQKQFCVNKSQNQLRSILVFNKDLSMKIESHGSVSRAKVKIKINPLMISEKTLSFTKELRI